MSIDDKGRSSGRLSTEPEKEAHVGGVQKAGRRSSGDRGRKLGINYEEYRKQKRRSGLLEEEEDMRQPKGIM